MLLQKDQEHGLHVKGLQAEDEEAIWPHQLQRIWRTRKADGDRKSVFMSWWYVP
jgi:hypothetical protein